MNKRFSTGDKVFYVIDYIFIFLVVCVTAYPFIFIISSSISDPGAVSRGEIWLLPKGFTLDSYKRVLQDPLVWRSYYNTIWYVVIGTAINILMTTITAYPLSRKNFSARNKLMLFVGFTMFFNGGLVPTYILVRNLHMLDTRWSMIFPAAISTWNLIIMRTFFESIPDSLHEAATIDGCTEVGILTRIYISLSGPVMAVMVLFYAVAHWNSYLDAMMYLNHEDLAPLQLLLRKILIQYDNGDMMKDLSQGRDAVGQTIRYATIIVSIIPIIMVYPFLQKYFVKGVMVGAIKG